MFGTNGAIGSTWIWAVIFAPFVGSFVLLLAQRLPAGQPVVFSRSQCAHCSHRLSALDLLPLVSWIVRQGKCRYCASPLGIFYPATELSALAIAIWAVIVLPDPMLIWAGCILGWALLGLAIADIRDFVVPDIFVLPLIPLGILLHWSVIGETPYDHLLGAVLGFLVFVAVAMLYRILRGREGLGFGDAKLLSAAGAWVGWAGLPSVIFLGAVFGLLAAAVLRLRGRKIDGVTALPFGPALALALWLVWLYGPLVSY